MRANLELTHGALFSQRALTALIEAGMTRDDAYRLVQSSAQRAFDEGLDFKELLAVELNSTEGAPAGVAEEVARLRYEDYLGELPALFARLEALRDSPAASQGR